MNVQHKANQYGGFANWLLQFGTMKNNRLKIIARPKNRLINRLIHKEVSILE